MTATSSIVYVVDDDPSVCTALRRLIRSVGLACEAFASAADFLAFRRPDAPACLILDVRMPGLSGLDLQRALATDGASIPIIFLSGHADVPMSVQAMKMGATEFLTKPFREQDLLDTIAQAIDRDRNARREQAKVTESRRRYESLTAREREVLALVVLGLPNKAVASTLGTTEKTVKVHRGHVMEKMEAGSLVDLVHMADALGIPLSPRPSTG